MHLFFFIIYHPNLQIKYTSQLSTYHHGAFPFIYLFKYILSMPVSFCFVRSLSDGKRHQAVVLSSMASRFSQFCHLEKNISDQNFTYQSCGKINSKYASALLITIPQSASISSLWPVKSPCKISVKVP